MEWNKTKQSICFPKKTCKLDTEKNPAGIQARNFKGANHYTPKTKLEKFLGFFLIAQKNSRHKFEFVTWVCVCKFAFEPCKYIKKETVARIFLSYEALKMFLKSESFIAHV